MLYMESIVTYRFFFGTIAGEYLKLWEYKKWKLNVNLQLKNYRMG